MNLKVNGMLGVAIPDEVMKKKGLSGKSPSEVVQAIEGYLNEAVFPKIKKAEGMDVYIRLNTEGIRAG